MENNFFKDGDIVITINLDGDEIYIYRIHSTRKASFYGHSFISLDGVIFIETCENNLLGFVGGYDRISYIPEEDLFDEREAYVILDPEKFPGIWEQLKNLEEKSRNKDQHEAASQEAINILDKILDDFWNSKKGFLVHVDRFLHPENY